MCRLLLLTLALNVYTCNAQGTALPGSARASNVELDGDRNDLLYYDGDTVDRSSSQKLKEKNGRVVYKAQANDIKQDNGRVIYNRSDRRGNRKDAGYYNQRNREAHEPKPDIRKYKPSQSTTGEEHSKQRVENITAEVLSLPEVGKTKGPSKDSRGDDKEERRVKGAADAKAEKVQEIRAIESDVRRRYNREIADKVKEDDSLSELIEKAKSLKEK